VKLVISATLRHRFPHMTSAYFVPPQIDGHEHVQSGLGTRTGLRLCSQRSVTIQSKRSSIVINKDYVFYLGGKLSLMEVSPSKTMDDLATILTLVCTLCNKATVFPNSPFHEKEPHNFTVNKQVLQAIGPTAYFKLARFVQRTETVGYQKRTPAMPAQLVLSLDHQHIHNKPDPPSEVFHPKVGAIFP
jgi:hypothetical protein